MLRFHWENVGPEHCEYVKDLLNVHFQAGTVLGPAAARVTVDELSLGSIPPVVQLLELSDVEPRMLRALKNQFDDLKESPHGMDTQLSVLVKYKGDGKRADARLWVPVVAYHVVAMQPASGWQSN